MNSVVLEDDPPNGLASMLAGLIDANLEREPTRRRLLRGGVYAVSAVDAGVSATIRVVDDGVRIDNGASVTADVRVRGRSADLLLLAGSPLRFGVPDPLSPAGRTVLALVGLGRIRIAGLVRHPVRASRLTRLLCVA